MKKILLLLALTTSPAVAQETQAPFDWKLRPEVGSKWQLRTFMRMKMTQVFPKDPDAKPNAKFKMPQKTDIVLLQKMSMDYDVIGKDEKGAFTVVVTYGPMDSAMSTMLDGKPLSANVQQMMTQAGKKFQNVFKGAKLTMKISPDGRLWNVVGLEALQKRMGDQLDLASVMMGGASTAVTSQTLNKDYFESLMQAGQLPTSPLEVGRGYSYTLNLGKNLPFSVSIVGSRILTGRLNGVATFAESATFDFGGFEKMIPKNVPVSMDVDFQGNIKGTTRVDEASGLPISGDHIMRYDGAISVQDPKSKRTFRMPMWMNLEMRQVMEPRS